MNTSSSNSGDASGHSPDPISVARSDHPPIVAGAVVVPTHASNWPVMIGIFSLVIGAIGALNAGATSCWTIVGPGFLESSGLVTNPQVETSLKTTRDNMVLIVATSFLALFLALLLVYSGIRLIQRRRAGAKASVWWAWLKIAYAVLAAAQAAFMSAGQIHASQQQMAAQGAPAFVTGIVGYATVVGIIFSLFWFSAYPAFMLIWFRRPTVKHAVAQWTA